MCCIHALRWQAIWALPHPAASEGSAELLGSRTTLSCKRILLKRQNADLITSVLHRAPLPTAFGTVRSL
jgi:hypothetical protein